MELYGSIDGPYWFEANGEDPLGRIYFTLCTPKIGNHIYDPDPGPGYFPDERSYLVFSHEDFSLFFNGDAGHVAGLLGWNVSAGQFEDAGLSWYNPYETGNDGKLDERLLDNFFAAIDRPDTPQSLGTDQGSDIIEVGPLKLIDGYDSGSWKSNTGQEIAPPSAVTRCKKDG